MPDNFYPKQRMDDAIERSRADTAASKERQQVRAGDHPFTALEARINADRRERDAARASQQLVTTRKPTRRVTRS